MGGAWRGRSGRCATDLLVVAARLQVEDLEVIVELNGPVLLGDLDGEEVVFGDEARQTRQALAAAASDAHDHHVTARLFDDAVR